MEFTTRAFSAPDLPDCLAIEQAAVRSNHYLADVLDYYTTTRGEFTVVCAEGKPIGIGKLTVLYDNSAWLELLRVHPQYQRQGAGTAILSSCRSWAVGRLPCTPASKMLPAQPLLKISDCKRTVSFAG